LLCLALLITGCDTLPDDAGAEEARLAAASSTPAFTDALANAQDKAPSRGLVVVANRAAGTLSVIDVRTDAVVETVPLPTPTTSR